MPGPHLHRIEASHAAGALLVEQCDIPGDMTLGQWRASRAATRPERPAGDSRLRARLRRALRRP